jgi:ketosteroid isomerase-like protein
VTDTRAAVLASDDAFFGALLAADLTALADVLTEDFVIVDVMSGGVTERGALLEALASTWCASSISSATLPRP